MSLANDAAYRFHAARYLQRQVKQITAHVEGVRKGEDVESVHQTRVASRRIRAAMKMFGDCWSADDVKRWQKPIRTITDALGEARDRDVQSQFLCGMLAVCTEPARVPGIARILSKVERKRESLQRKVLKALERLEKSKVLPEMQRAAKTTLAECGPGNERLNDHAREQTKPYLRRQLHELLFDEESLENPEDHHRHHAMRISAKRLRYTLEIARPLFEGRLDEIIEAAKKVQSYLGEIHDCDVWVDDLATFARKEYRRVEDHFGGAGRCARLRSGIDYLSEERAERRRQAFVELVDYWHGVKSQGVWERLIELTEPCMPESLEPAVTEQVEPAAIEPAPAVEPAPSPEPPAAEAAPTVQPAAPVTEEKVAAEIKPAPTKKLNGTSDAARELALFIAAD